MQSGLFIEILVLQSERLVRVLVNPLVLFQTTLMLTSDEVVKEQTFQMISKKEYETNHRYI